MGVERRNWLAAACWSEHAQELQSASNTQQTTNSNTTNRTRNNWTSQATRRGGALALLVVILLASHDSGRGPTQLADTLETAPARLADQLVEQLASVPALSQAATQFDSSKFSTLIEAIRAHPDLREFARLCELRGVREIVSMDTTPLSVFAPTDRALADLLAKADARQLNLAELAKHHIAQGFVSPDNIDKLPHQFQSYAQFSPLYLNRLASQARNQPEVFINNAKILATYVIQIESDFQVLHVIDEALEFAYVSKRAMASLLGSGGDSRSRSSKTLKRPLDLNFLQETGSEAGELAQAAVADFAERFADLSSGQPQLELYRSRGSAKRGPAAASAMQQPVAKWARLFRADHSGQLKGKLYQPESLNTYFLPIASDELDQLLDGDSNLAIAALQAHVVPNEVLFTRHLPIGHQRVSSAGVALNLAKTIPETSNNQTLGQLEAGELSRRLSGSPLLVQASGKSSSGFRAGVSSAEVLVANIPLAHGVLHLIKRPLVVPTNSLLDFINNNEHQLSDLTQAAGSQTARVAPARLELNRFRELLARADKQLLASFSHDYAHANRTILAPTDEAFARLRYDLRALILGDELLIPNHWDPAYRQVQLERILRRHLVEGRTLTSEQFGRESIEVSSLNNFKLLFEQSAHNPELFQVKCDSTLANLIHLDLLGSNGALHLIDRVLGEELETIHSLLRSLVLKNSAKYAQLSESPQASPFGELAQFIELKLRSLQAPANNDLQPVEAEAGQLDEHHQKREPRSESANQNSRHERAGSSPELQAVRKSIGQFLDELGSEKRQLLATSVNVSVELARLSSRAESRDDWNDKFKLQERAFTYFAPTDLAWLRLVQQQPELYKPLVHFLEQPASGLQLTAAGPLDQAAGGGGGGGELAAVTEQPLDARPRASESSHRLLQILERHLIGNKKLAARELNQLDSLHTVGGATLRLVAQPVNSFAVDANGQATSSFAALHSIASLPLSEQQSQPSGPVRRALKLGASEHLANIVEVHETSNGFVYLLDQVLVQPDDTHFLVQTSPSSAAAGAMSSLLGAHNSAIIDAIHSLFTANGITNASTMITLIGSLMLAILLLTALLLVLIVRRRRQSKLNRHQQLESGGLTSSSSANSGSTSTTKSL